MKGADLGSTVCPHCNAPLKDEVARERHLRESHPDLHAQPREMERKERVR